MLFLRVSWVSVLASFHVGLAVNFLGVLESNSFPNGVSQEFRCFFLGGDVGLWQRSNETIVIAHVWVATLSLCGSLELRLRNQLSLSASTNGCKRQESCNGVHGC